MAGDGKHTCPGCRTKRIPDRVLTCAPCWYELPAPIRSAIVSTARLSILAPKRRAALQGAFDFWRERDHGRVEEIDP
jgi:branched-subunit amino acid aminotransferase/4-amino-4-deoxychorismate lyase